MMSEFRYTLYVESAYNEQVLLSQGKTETVVDRDMQLLRVAIMLRQICCFPSRRKAQSLVEMALMFTVLMIILSGLVEFGFWMLEYSSLITATRNGARFAINNDHRFIRAECQLRQPSCNRLDPAFDEDVCNDDFYCKVARLIEQELEQRTPRAFLDPSRGDDIVISVFTFTGGNPAVVTDRFPYPTGYWSYYGNQGTRFDATRIRDLLNAQGVAATSSGYVLVEAYYHYKHKLGLPWIRAFVPDPLPLYTYVFMPLYSAAPTPTP